MPSEPSTSPPPIPVSSSTASASSPLGCVGYVCAGASFIPLLGVLFGIIAIVWGLIRRAWGLVALGAGGILFSVLLYGGLFYFGLYQRGGIYDRLRAQGAVIMLNGAVKEIEFYKLQHGRYPTALSELDTKDKNKIPVIFDPTAVQRGGESAKAPYFFYELDGSGTFYFLRSVGPDGVPFTADDILPSLSEEERKNTGLRLQR